MAVRLTYTGTSFADQIRQQGFRPGGILSVAPGKIFSTTNPAFASTYGTPINLATSTRAFSLPSFNFSSGVFGKEVIQSPEAATKGMKVAQTAERLKNVSPTAAKLLSGQTVSGFGGAAAPGFLRTAARTVLGPLGTVTLGPQAIAMGMAPKTEAGFDFMKGFDEGAITGIMDETSTGQDIEDFAKGIMAADAAAIQKAALNTAELSPQMSSPRALGAEDIFRPELQTQESKGILGLLKSGGAKIRDTFLQGVGAQGGLNIGAKLGMMVNPALALPAGLLGAFLGATGIREATPGEKGIQSLYGGQNTIAPGTLFVDPVTGELVETEMGGYNIVSGRGKGLPSAIDKRLATIEKTRQRKGQLSQFLQERKERLEAEKAAAEAAELAGRQQAARKAIADAGSGFDDYGPGQSAGMGFGGGRSDPTDKS